MRPLRPLRIAQVTSLFPPATGGTSTICYHNARELARLGHEVHIFTSAQAGAAASEEVDGLHIHRLRPLMQSGGAALLPGLLWSLQGFDLIHLYYPFFGSEGLRLGPQARHTPLVVTFHQDGEPPGLRGLLKGVLRQTMGRALLRAADRVLFTSLDYAQASPVWPLLRDRASRVSDLPAGVDLNAFSPGPAPAELRARYGFLRTDQVALMVTRLDKAHVFQGVDLFLAALAWLPPHVKALIVGGGELLDNYQVAARVLGVDSRVIFAGPVSRDALPDYYRLADVTVLPAVSMGDAFGSTAVESLATATPVVASDLPGVRATVAQGSDGVLITPNDSAALAGALGWILRYEANRHLMGMHGRAKVEQTYGWRQIGQHLETVYCQVLAEGRDVPVLHMRTGRPRALPLAERKRL